MSKGLEEGRALSYNERMLLDLIRLHQPIARSRLTGLTDLTQQSVHRLLEGLIAAGLVELQAARRSGPGKPSPDLILKADAVNALGILINTDSVVISLVDFNCHVLAERRLEIPLSDRKSALVRLRAEVDALLADQQVAHTSLSGLGFAVSGFFVDGGRAFNAPEPLRDWSLIDLRPELRERFKLPVYVDNNANAGAIGESLNGVGRWCTNFAYLSFNYGFGGGVIIDGKPYRGHFGNAGEFSGIYTEEENPRRPALQYLLRSLLANGIDLQGIADLRNTFDPDWPGVAEWVQTVGPQLDRLVHAISAILDPEAIVFGGELPPRLGQMLIDQIHFRKDHRYGIGRPEPKLLLSQAEGDPAAAGAALLPLKSRYFL